MASTSEEQSSMTKSEISQDLTEKLSEQLGLLDEKVNEQ